MKERKIIPTNEALEIMSAMVISGDKREDIARAMGVSLTTLASWISSDDFPEIKERYMEAKRIYAHDVAEAIMREASAPLHPNPKLANAEVQRRRLIVDASKWIACKLLPKVYGDNLVIDHNHSGKVELSPLAQLRQLESKGPVVEVEVEAKASTGPPVNASFENDLALEEITLEDCI